jgi:hypothetical protein
VIETVMVEKESQSGTAYQNSAQAPQRVKRWRLWLLLAALALIAGGGAFAAWWRSSPTTNAAGRLEGELIVLVRPTQQSKELIDVDKADALPVRFGGSMGLEIRLNPDAYSYLVWLNCDGQTVPLYPWNFDTVEVTDANDLPPTRRTAKVVYSPITSGKSWKFGKQSGLETVLLLARRTPLDPGTKLGSLIGTLPPAKARHREELAILSLDSGSDSVSTLLARNRGTDEEARAIDEPLRAIMLRLREHFEVVRAVRFAHVEDFETEKK